MFIFVDPSDEGDNPMLLPMVTDEGASTDLLIAVTPSDAEILALVPKLVLFPTLRDVRLPLVTDRFSVLLPVAAVGATTVGPVGVIVDCPKDAVPVNKDARKKKWIFFIGSAIGLFYDFLVTVFMGFSGMALMQWLRPWISDHQMSMLHP
jgi:hypothetical protein